MLAGESIFILPFVIARIFRPTFLDAFEITNLELGSAFSVYGVIALISYFFGGPFADRFSPKYLMSIALLLTGTSGFYFATIPSIQGLILLFGFWGFTTIWLFWSPLIRATREWGGHAQQGIAFGLLDGGRGLVAAMMASISIYFFSQILGENLGSLSLEQKKSALGDIIYSFSIFCSFVGLLVLVLIPRTNPRVLRDKLDFAKLAEVIRHKKVWLNAIVILCAYVGYKTTDDFSLLARDAYGYDDVKAAKIGSVSYWVRPVIAIVAGYLADVTRSSFIIIIGFIITLAGSILIALNLWSSVQFTLLALTIIFISTGIYSLRGIYFALVAESNIPLSITGTAVGVISVVGYLPDIFMGPLMGYLLDSSPGFTGHKHVFMVLAGFSIIGLCAILIFRRLISRHHRASVLAREQHSNE